jgi:stress response protein YsnF
MIRCMLASADYSEYLKCPRKKCRMPQPTVSEQAVVSKTARVVEEVNLRKDVTHRVETVKDMVRRDEVEIEKVPGEKITAASS